MIGKVPCQFRKHIFRRFKAERIRIFDNRIHKIGLLSGKDILSDKIIHFFGFALGGNVCNHRLAPGRHRFDDGNIEIAEHRQRKRPRYGRRTHHQKMRSLFSAVDALLDNCRSLEHAEAVLFVDNNHTQVFIQRLGGKKGVRTDDKVDITGGKLL